MPFFSRALRRRVALAAGAGLAALRSVYPVFRGRVRNWAAALPGRGARAALGYIRRRRAIAYRTMSGTRRRMALGLAKFRVLSTMKYPCVTLRMASGDVQTQVLRICPLGAKTSTSAMYMLPSLFRGDERFKALSELYTQFRILNVVAEVRLLFASRLNNGTLSMFGRVIRSCNKSMNPTVFWEGTGAIYTPGIVWRQATDLNSMMSLELSCSPSSATEKDCWYSTDMTATTDLNQADWDSDQVFDFCPALDFAICYTQVASASADFQVSIFYRVTCEFRSANSAFGSGDSSSKVITFSNASQVSAVQNAIESMKSGVETVTGGPRVEVLDE